MEDNKKYEYTLQSYMKNPIGAGAASGSQRQAIVDALFGRYRHLLKESGGSFKFNAYKVSDSIILSVKVPSESVEGVTYDVCIEFMGVGSLETSLLPKKIKIFSNNFAFVFTYAYVFNQRELLVEYLRPLLPKEALTQPPKTRNPDETINYEKSVVYAILFIQEHRLFMRENYNKFLAVSNKISIKNAIRSFEDIERDYANKKHLQSEKKAAEKRNRQKTVTVTELEKKRVKKGRSPIRKTVKRVKK